MRRTLSSNSLFEKDIAYSRAVVEGDFVFVSGTTGYDYQKMRVSPLIQEQTEQCFINIEKVLREAGSALSEVVRVTYILPNKYEFELCWPIIRKYFNDVRPAATMFEAGLLNDDMKIEIQVTAKIAKQLLQPRNF